MALEFDVKSFRQDEKNKRIYHLEVSFRGCCEKYELVCNMATKIRIDSPLMITVDDRIPENGDDLQLRVSGISPSAKRLEKKLEEALRKYAFNQ